MRSIWCVHENTPTTIFWLDDGFLLIFMLLITKTRCMHKNLEQLKSSIQIKNSYLCMFMSNDTHYKYSFIYHKKIQIRYESGNRSLGRPIRNSALLRSEQTSHYINSIHVNTAYITRSCRLTHMHHVYINFITKELRIVCSKKQQYRTARK